MSTKKRDFPIYEAGDQMRNMERFNNFICGRCKETVLEWEDSGDEGKLTATCFDCDITYTATPPMYEISVSEWYDKT